MLIYCLSDPYKLTSVKFESKYNDFNLKCIWLKILSTKWQSLCSVTMSQCKSDITLLHFIGLVHMKQKLYNFCAFFRKDSQKRIHEWEFQHDMLIWFGPLSIVYISECWYITLGADSIKRCLLTSIWNPIVEIRRSYDRLISTMGFPIQVRLHLYIESGPRFLLLREIQYVVWFVSKYFSLKCMQHSMFLYSWYSTSA